MKYTVIVTICLLISISANAQEGAAIYFGPGFGFDHGGLGVKLTHQPEKHIGIFGGAGYNLAAIGVNGGLIWNILPDKRVTPVITAMYGYNAVIKLTYPNGRNRSSVYKGLTIGGGIDIKLGHSRKNK